MTPNPLRIRLAIAGAAFSIAVLLAQSVASFARPTQIEQLAQAKKATVTVAAAR